MSQSVNGTSPVAPIEDSKVRLLVVSNRLPITITKTDTDYSLKMSSGGLVTALSGLKKMMAFTWIGWPGELIY